MLPLVYEEFVKTGKLELIHLDFPLEMHPRAFKAAEAAACAGEQGMFWDMHDQLYANQSALAPDQLASHAEELGLDAAAFQKCLGGGKHAPEIREDIRAVRSLGISGTPAYVLAERVAGGNKVQVLDIIKGLPSYEQLKERLVALLAPEG